MTTVINLENFKNLNIMIINRLRVLFDLISTLMGILGINWEEWEQDEIISEQLCWIH